MMDEAKSYKVCIFDDQYSLLSDEPEDHVQSLARHVDMVMREISVRAQGASQKKIAVLAALQFASHAKGMEEQLQDLEGVQKRLSELIDGELK